MRTDRNILARLLATAFLAFLFFPVRAGASTGCVYPADLDGWADKVAGDYLTIPDVNQFRCAIEKIQAALGIDPAGSYDTVVERLDDLVIAVGKSGGQTIAGGTSANTLTLKPYASSTTQLLLEAGRISFSSGNISTASANALAINLAATFTGSGESPAGLNIATTLEPASSISGGVGALIASMGDPGSGVEIGSTVALMARLGTGSSGGSIGSSAAVQVVEPLFGSTKPELVAGVYIANQGASGVTSATGLWVEAQTGASNNVAARIDGLVDLSAISGSEHVFSITPTTDTSMVVATSWLEHESFVWAPTIAPAGLIKIKVGVNTRYIPFWP